MWSEPRWNELSNVNIGMSSSTIAGGSTSFLALDDIFVCTPPKCGTTWMQTIVVELLFPDDVPGPVTELSPWIDSRIEPVDTLMARLDAQPHRRTLKTHTPADGIPWYPSASYIVVGRDGRDAFMSYWNHWHNMHRERLPYLAASSGRGRDH